MFWGCQLKKGEPYKVQKRLEEGEYPVLHLSSAVLSADAKKGNNNNKSFVTVSIKNERKDQKENDIKNLVIAVLEPEKNESQALDLYFNIQQNVTISVQGSGNTVHLSGYFESNNAMEDMYGG